MAYFVGSTKTTVTAPLFNDDSLTVFIVDPTPVYTGLITAVIASPQWPFEFPMSMWLVCHSLEC